MKNYLCLLAAAALLIGCGQNTDVADKAAPPPEPYISSTPVVVAGQNSGTFTVDARSDPGATFENNSAAEATFEFAAKGQWSFAEAAGMLGPNGADAPAGANFVLPGVRSFALVAKRADGTVQLLGERSTLTLKPNETISFCMNEMSGTFGDNRGSLTVQWSKK
jgi:hypothetical protein